MARSAKVVKITKNMAREDIARKRLENERARVAQAKNPYPVWEPEELFEKLRKFEVLPDRPWWSISAVDKERVKQLAIDLNIDVKEVYDDD